MSLSRKLPKLLNLKMDDDNEEEEATFPPHSDEASILEKKQEETYTTDEFLKEIKRLKEGNINDE